VALLSSFVKSYGVTSKIILFGIRTHSDCLWNYRTRSLHHFRGFPKFIFIFEWCFKSVLLSYLNYGYQGPLHWRFTLKLKMLRIYEITFTPWHHPERGSPSALNCCESLKLLLHVEHVIYEYCILKKKAANSNGCCCYSIQGVVAKLIVSRSLYTRTNVAYL
jgi:hypothetical protein